MTSMPEVRYENLKAFEAAVATRVRVYVRGCLATEIEILPEQGRTVIEHQGKYFLRVLVKEFLYLLNAFRDNVQVVLCIG